MNYRTWVVAGLLSLVPFAGPANAGFEAISGTAVWLEVLSDEPESDTLLRLMCRRNDFIETRLGATIGIGKGEYDEVSVTLSAGSKKAQLSGKSIQSENIEMTGGTELLTYLSTGDEIFDVLVSGKEITLESSDKKTERFALGSKTTASLKTFLKKCKAIK